MLNQEYSKSCHACYGQGPCKEKTKEESKFLDLGAELEPKPVWKHLQAFAGAAGAACLSFYEIYDV